MPISLSKELLAREAHLGSILKETEGALVAYSGGVDSSYLLYKALQILGAERLLAVTVSSAAHPHEETKAASAFASGLGVPHRIVDFDILSIAQFAANTPERCYYCKKELLSTLDTLAAGLSLPVILDGSNLDDDSDYRPGKRALLERGARSPLAEAGLSKDDIRLLSRARGLSTWNKPSAACLASRFPYGEKLSKEKMNQIEEAERFLRKLGINGDLRVRSHEGSARIEVSPQLFNLLIKSAGAVATRFRQLGFSYISLDLEGFRTGSMNLSLE